MKTLPTPLRTRLRKPTRLQIISFLLGSATLVMLGSATLVMLGSATLVMLGSAAGAQTPSTPAPPQALPDAPSTIAHEAPPAEPTGPTVLFDTSLGRITCKFFSKEAPETVANFIGLATGAKDWTDPVTREKASGKPFYDGTLFHRVIPNFMIQGGDRLGTGAGDPGFYFADEFSPSLRFDVPGRLAMANSGPDSNGSQFFITETAQPELNGKHTIFGQCDPHSVLIVSTIARVDRNSEDKPVTPVMLNKVTIVPEGQPIPPVPATPGAPAAPGAPSAPGATPPGFASHT